MALRFDRVEASLMQGYNAIHKKIADLLYEVCAAEHKTGLLNDLEFPVSMSGKQPGRGIIIPQRIRTDGLVGCLVGWRPKFNCLWSTFHHDAAASVNNQPTVGLAILALLLSK